MAKGSRCSRWGWCRPILHTVVCRICRGIHIFVVWREWRRCDVRARTTDEGVSRSVVSYEMGYISNPKSWFLSFDV
ncbi:hypothetical protein F4861DRAFT_516104 [Xylaria intraflava]|nr:hypothetical protein F4861DRAFT_516104 [Xylaria intraflava]